MALGTVGIINEALDIFYSTYTYVHSLDHLPNEKLCSAWYSKIPKSSAYESNWAHFS